MPGYTPASSDRSSPHIMIASEGFGTAMGIPLLAGRDISSHDVDGAPMVAVVNEAFANKYLAGKNPVGQTFEMSQKTVEIVGLFRNAKYEDLRSAAPPTFYLNYQQSPDKPGGMVFALRTAMDPLSLANSVRGIVADVDRQMPVAEVRTQEQQIAESIGPERFFAGFASAFGLLAALLAALGLYGVMAYNVARRTPEIGVRMALGAAPGDVQRLVVRDSVLVVLAGIVVGIPAAFALMRIVRSALYEVTPADPVSFIGGAVLMLAIAAVAAWLPARRAARVDPLIALRHE